MKERKTRRKCKFNYSISTVSSVSVFPVNKFALRKKKKERKKERKKVETLSKLSKLTLVCMYEPQHVNDITSILEISGKFVYMLDF